MSQRRIMRYLYQVLDILRMRVLVQKIVLRKVILEIEDEN